MSSTYYTVLDENDRLILLTMIAYTPEEYRFLYQTDSWVLRIHESEVRANMFINHALQSPDGSPIIKTIVKFRKDNDGYWQSTVLHQQGEEIKRAPNCSFGAENILRCAAVTLRKIYYGS